MRHAHRDGTPGASRRRLDPRDKAHQHEIGELDDVWHGHRIGPFEAAAAGALDEFEAVAAQHGLKVSKGSKRSLEIGGIGHEVAERIAGETSAGPMLQAKIGVTRDTRSSGKELCEFLERDPSEFVPNDLHGELNFLQDRKELGTVAPQHFSQSRQDKRPNAMLTGDGVDRHRTRVRSNEWRHPLLRHTAEDCALADPPLWSEVKYSTPIVNPSCHCFVTVYSLASKHFRDERPSMTDEDMIVPTGQFVRDPSPDDLERMLETLIVIAQDQGRNFLAYLLIMALMHVREENQGRSQATH